MQEPTVRLEKDYVEKSMITADGSVRSRQLRGTLFAAGAEFSWHANRVNQSWFVAVASTIFGSRGQMTRDDPVNFALELAKEMALSTRTTPS